MNERDRGSQGADEPLDEGLSRLYRTGAHELPSPQIDAAILAAARREVGAGPERAGRSTSRQWRIPLALAAVLVLSVSLVTVVMEERGEELSQPRSAEAPPPTAGKPTERAKAPAAEGVEVAAPEPLARKREQAPAATTPARSGIELVPERATAGRSDQRAESTESKAAPADGTARPRPAAPPVRARVPSFDSATREPAVAQETEAASPPFAQSVPGAAADRLGQDRSGPATAGAAQRGSAQDETKASAMQAKPSPRLVRQVQSLADEPPDRWLERIAQLRREERSAEADELLAEFRRRFPGHPVPASAER